MWSVISITEPGAMSGSSEPAALVRISFVDADAGQHLQRRPHDRGVAVLVVMRAAGQHQHRRAGKTPGDDLAGMAGDAAPGKAGQVGIGDADGVLDLVDQPAEAGAQHQRGLRREPAEPLDQRDRQRRSFQYLALEAVGQHLAHGDRLDDAGLVAQMEPGGRSGEFGEPLAAAAAGVTRGMRSAITAISAILPPPPMM